MLQGDVASPRLRAPTLSLLILIATAAPAVAQAVQPPSPAPPTVEACRISGRIVIDGRLDEADWRQAVPADRFTQRDPNEGQPPANRTEIRVLFDADALYVGARMHDTEPRKIARRLSRRDDGANGIADSIVVALDPHHDRLTGVRFEVTAAGALRDAALYNDSSDDGSWDAVWEASVLVDDGGWTAEMRIPFSQLRFPAAERHTWGINVIRYTQRTNEEDWLVPVDKKDSSFVSRMGLLTGLVGVHPRRHLDLLPYTTFRGEFSGTVQPGNPFSDGRRVAGGLGLDAKWGMTSNLTVDVSLNPDFGQVEVDPAVVNLTAFETFYEEKRPFFIEGANILDNFGRNGVNGTMGFNRANPTLFYSRRIGRAPQGRAVGDFVDTPGSTTILGAAKLTGKTASGWSLGLIEAVTGRERADVALGEARDSVDVEPLTNYFVARIRRDVGQRAGFGMIATAVSRDLRTAMLAQSLVEQAYVIGGDGHLFFDSKREWVVSSGLSASHVSGPATAITRLQRSSARYFQRPDASHLSIDPAATSMSGWNFQLDFNHNQGTFKPNASVWAVSPGYETNDVGFMTGADKTGSHVAFDWNKPTPDRFSRYRMLMVAKWWAWNFAREQTGDGLWSMGYATFPNYWEGQATIHVGRATWSDRLTRGGPLMLNPGFRQVSGKVSSDNRKPITIGLTGEYFSTSEHGWEGTAGLSVNWKPAPTLTFEAGPTYMRSHTVAQYVQAVSDPAAVATYGVRYVFSDLDLTEMSMTTRINLLLTPRVSLQVYAQPLLSVGRYFNLKEAAAPRTYSFARYGTDLGAIQYLAEAAAYRIDPSGNGSGQTFAVANPDFNFKSMRVNAVFRWEFKPGSTFYLVWTQMRQDYAHPGQLGFSRDIGSLFGAPGDNAVMAKLSYWFSR